MAKPPTLQKSKIKKQGYLEKESAVFNISRKRWMIVEGHNFYSFRDEQQRDQEQPTEWFDLAQYNQVRKCDKGKTGQFEVSSGDDTRIFYASSESEMKDWIKHLRNATRGSSGSPKKRTTTATSNAKKSAANASKASNRKVVSASKKKKPSTNTGSGNTKTKTKTATHTASAKKTNKTPRLTASHSHTASAKKSKTNANGKASTSTKTASKHGKAASTFSSSVLSFLTPSDQTQQQHQRGGTSISSIFGSLSLGFDLPVSQTALTDDEDSSQRPAPKQPPQTQPSQPLSSYAYTNEFYSVTFTSKPFLLTLWPLHDDTGAVIMQNLNAEHAHIRVGSQFIAVNGLHCQNHKFQAIKDICKNAQLPTNITFLRPNAKRPQTLAQPVSANTSRSNSASPRPAAKRTAATTTNSKPTTPKPARTAVKTKTASTAKTAAASSSSSSRASKLAQQNRDKKSARILLESLHGMNDIKEAQRLERLRQWKECASCYERGIESLEKSLQSVSTNVDLTKSQKQQCQSQIDEYCRVLITIQRQHKKDINAKPKTKPNSKLKNHDRSASVTRAKQHQQQQQSRPKRNSNSSHSSYKSDDVDEHDEDSVFGANNQQQQQKPPPQPKRESAVAAKKKDMARMKREMATGKLETNSDDKHDDDDNKNKNDELYSFLDRSDAEKKHKEKMSKPVQKKKTVSSKTVAKKPSSKNSKENKDRNKKKKTGKKAGDNNNGDDDDDDDQKENGDGNKKKSSGVAKQDAEFRSRLEADIISEAPDVCFKDVEGLANVKLALYETIILPAMRPELFTGLRSPTAGLLLFGPPGNGKTMIAKCVAAECDSTFFSISASSITSKFVGDAERIMRSLFDLAREKAPSIIFIDEIDSMLTARGGKNEAESSRRIKTEFLIQFDGVKKASDSAKRVLVIGATNLPDQLDEAVLRRFGKRIMVPLPDADTRGGILQLLMSRQKTELSDADYAVIVAQTQGYSCSDLSTLCKDAAMGPIRSLGAKILEMQSSEMPAIKKTHFEGALANVRPSLTPESLGYFNDWNDKYGSKIHLSISALPENMKPYTREELEEIVRKREEAEKKQTEEVSASESEGDSDMENE